MRFRHAVGAGLVILLVVASWPVAGGAPRTGNQEGGGPMAPDFSVTAYGGGRSVSLSDVKGKVTLLYFFFPS